MAKLVEYMPIAYRSSNVAKDITYPMDLENDATDALIAEYVNQFVVSTATFSLSRYEEQYGLDVDPRGITLDERRSRIKAKMRSVGAVNSAMLQNVVNAWTNADIEVVEDYANYTVTIKFVSIVGIPSNMQDVYDAIDRIKPSHLIFKYEFKYNTVNVLRTSGYTVKSLAGTGKTVLQVLGESL